MKIQIITASLILTGIPTIASAYVGPGAGLSAIGSLLALLVAVLVAFIGFFWYPIKRLIGGRKEPTLEGDGVMENNEHQGTEDRNR